MRKTILRYSLLLILFSALFSLFVPNVFAESISVPPEVKAYEGIPVQYTDFSRDCYVFKIRNRNTNQYIAPPSSQLAPPCFQDKETYFSQKELATTGNLSFDGLDVGNYNLSLYKNECGLFAISCSLSQKTNKGFQVIPGSITPTPTTTQPTTNQPPTFTPPPGPCTNNVCKTAIGDIDASNPQAFIKKVFAVILSLSGGVALLLIIFSGYKLMLSQGNPEKAQEAKETLTAAIVGLLFIIFSLVILQVIGVDILRIPGFGK